MKMIFLAIAEIHIINIMSLVYISIFCDLSQNNQNLEKYHIRYVYSSKFFMEHKYGIEFQSVKRFLSYGSKQLKNCLDQ